ncbi:MAG: hypothetical protein ACI84O_001552 [Myxococcota bacterium]|jgi:hypothetical protein
MLPLLATIFLVASQSTPQLFVDTNVLAAPGIGSVSSAAQHRTTSIDILLLDANTTQLELNLFPGTTLQATFISREQYADGYIWRGTIQGHLDSSADFSVVNGIVMGTVRFDEELFQIEYAGNNVHRIKHEDQSLAPGCGNDASHAVKSAVQQSGNNSRSGNPDIDLLLVYSTAAKNAVGGASAMSSKINLAISETNSAYTSSGVTQQVHLVHSEEMVGYVEPSNFGTILSDLSGTNDGKMDSVHGLRDQYAADCVAMICQNGAYCGIAYLMTNVSTNFANSAFSVTNYSCATGYYSFGHELGHNMGSNHDPQNASSGAYSYSYGFRTSNNSYRTIMAYSPGTRIRRFSGPNVSYNGYTMGNASQDNHRSLNNTAPTVADFRISTPPPPSGPTLTVPTLTAGSGVILTVEDCAPNGQVQLLYSLAGGGPTVTTYGTVLLSAPIKALVSLTADNNGYRSWFKTVPAGAAGVQLWLQAYDYGSSTFSNGVNTIIL